MTATLQRLESFGGKVPEDLDDVISYSKDPGDWAAAFQKLGSFREKSICENLHATLDAKDHAAKDLYLLAELSHFIGKSSTTVLEPPRSIQDVLKQLAPYLNTLALSAQTIDQYCYPRLSYDDGIKANVSAQCVPLASP